MRGSKAKTLRRAIYGDHAYPGEAVVNTTGWGRTTRSASMLRRAYRKAKREARDR